MFPTPASTRFIGERIDTRGDLIANQSFDNPSVNDPPGGGPDGVLAEGPDQFLVKVRKAIVSLWDYEDLRFTPIQAKISTTFDQYNNVYMDDDSKDEDQSQQAMPQVFMLEERITSTIMGFIDQEQNWFQAEASVPQFQVLQNLNTEWLRVNLENSNFWDRLEESVKFGCLTGQMIMTVQVEVNNIPISTPTIDNDGLPEDNQDPNSIFNLFTPSSVLGQYSAGLNPDKPFITNPNLPRLKFTCVPPSLVRLDGTGAGRYKMWRTQMGIGEFIQTAQKRGYDVDACRRALSHTPKYRDRDDNRRTREQFLNRSQESTKHTVDLLHFEGYLHNPIDAEPLGKAEGDFEPKKVYWVVANDAEIVFGPSDIPFWDNESVMVHAPFVSVPGSVYGKSPVCEAADVFNTRHATNNMLIDYMVKVLGTPVQVDYDLLHQDAIREGEIVMFPNAKIKIEGRGAPNANAVRPVEWPDLPVGFWNYIQYFSTQQAEMTGMTQELAGMPRTRGRITGMEYQTRASEAGSLMRTIYKGIERRFLIPVLHRSFLRLLQFTPDHVWKSWVLSRRKALMPDSEQATPELKQAWDDAIVKVASWTKEQRFNYLGTYFAWTVKVWNTLADRQMEIEKGTFFLNVIGRLPNGWQMVQLNKIVERIAAAFGWNPEEIMNKTFLPLPRADLDMDSAPDRTLNARTNDQPLLPPDISGGRMAQMQQALGGVEGGGSPFPGGPRNVTPNLPKEPEQQ